MDSLYMNVKGVSKKLRRQVKGRGFAKCLFYYISLCSKLAYGGGRGVKNWQNLAYVVYVWSLMVLAFANRTRLN